MKLTVTIKLNMYRSFYLLTKIITEAYHVKKNAFQHLICTHHSNMTSRYVSSMWSADSTWHKHQDSHAIRECVTLDLVSLYLLTISFYWHLA